MIIFKDWTISAPREVIARQYDNMSRVLMVIGDLPEGYTWDMLVQVGRAMDIIHLIPMEGGVGVTLTADQLSQSGYYSVQLRGTRGEEVRHTNVESVFIPASLSGSGQWPTVPSEFIQAEQRIREIAVHPPVPGDNGFWMLWDPDAGRYVDFAFPLPETSPVDNTLSNEGEAADAKAVGDALGQLAEGIGGCVKTVNGLLPDKSQNVEIPSEWSSETTVWENVSEVITGQFVNKASNENGYQIATHVKYAYAVAKVTRGYGYRVTCASPKDPGFIVMFRDENGVKIGVVAHTQSGEINLYENLVIEVPDGAYDMVINSYIGSSSLYPSAMPVIEEGTVTSPKLAFEQLTAEKEQLAYENEQLVRRVLKAEKGNDFAWGTFDKAYFVFVHDDTNSFLPTAYSAFHAENVPLSAATIASKLSEEYNGKTVKEWLDLLAADGGEVLMHYDADLLNASDDGLWRTHIVTPKQTLEKEGFVVRGLILANDSEARSEKGEKFCRRYYDYADKVGVSSQYDIGRTLMLEFADLDTFKAHIDVCAAKPGIYAFGFHGLRTDEAWITQASLQEMIQYIAGKDGTEITTYSAVFDSIGTTVLENRIAALEKA